METLQYKKVKTRKEHNCWGCARPFPAGSVLLYTVTVDGGDFGSSYWCDVCRETMDRDTIGMDDEPIFYGDVKQYDDWEDVRKELDHPTTGGKDR